MNSVLYVVATPIGNMEDLTIRARRVLGEVDAIACEDTRQTRKLFERYEISSPKIIFSYHEHNEEKAGVRILELLKSGRSVALCSDAGYPGISDPGYRIISRAKNTGLEVQVLPGAGAVEVALLASGLPTSSFTFLGYPPRKSGKRRNFLRNNQDSDHTLILFESPRRVGGLLQDALDVLGDRLAAVCLELTKKFETVHRNFLTVLVQNLTNVELRGEVTVVIAGNNPKFFRKDGL